MSHSIPKVIHKVYIDHSMTMPKEFPEEMQEAHDTWEVLNPDYEVRYYSGQDCEKYLLKHYSERHLKAFRKIKPYALKCDFIRYCIMYQEGGVYTDCKMVCLIELDKFLKEDTTWASSWDLIKPNMWTGLLIGKKGNPIMKTAIEMCLYNIENNVYGKQCLDPTSPGLLGKAFAKNYPDFEFDKQINKDGILLGIFRPTRIFFNDILSFKSKCDRCSKGQDWKDGNNYVKMWFQRDLYW